MARPTKYSDKTLTKARDYLDSCEDTKKNVNLPTWEGLSIALEITRETMYQWKAEHPAFSDILEELNKLQAQRLINKGLSGKYNSTIAKLILSKHGYKEQIGLSGEGEGEPIKVHGEITGVLDKIYGSHGVGSKTR